MKALTLIIVYFLQFTCLAKTPSSLNIDPLDLTDQTIVYISDLKIDQIPKKYMWRFNKTFYGNPAGTGFSERVFIEGVQNKTTRQKLFLKLLDKASLEDDFTSLNDAYRASGMWTRQTKNIQGKLTTYYIIPKDKSIMSSLNHKYIQFFKKISKKPILKKCLLLNLIKVVVK